MTKRFAFILFAIISASLHAEVCSKNRDSSKKTSDQAPPCPCKQMPYYYDKDSYYGFAYGEWLYWQPVTEDSQDWSRTVYSQDSVTNYDYNTQTYDFSSGLRLGFGIRLKEGAIKPDMRPWQIETVFTYINSSSNDSDQPSAPSSVQPAFAAPDEFGSLDKYLKGNSDITLRQFRYDAFVSWPMWAADSIIFRLSTGATYASFKNKWRLNFNSKYQANPLASYSADLLWKWHGAGLMGGSDVFLPIGAGFGFYADTSFALLFGPMLKKEAYSFVDSGTTSISATNHDFTFQPNLLFGAGLDYKYWICEKVLAHLMVGWEFNIWFNLNQFADADSLLAYSIDAPLTAGEYFWLPSSNLMYQGLTLRAGLDY